MLISDFARLGQVSVRMLRHYDQVGLLTPSQVDPFTGYRSYAPEQLHHLNRLVALKDLGFNLEQVKRLLGQDIDVDELRGMLRLRRAELEEEARAIDTRLTAVESRLRMMEKDKNTMSGEFVTKTVPALRLVAVQDSLRPEEMGERIAPMFDRVAAGISSVCGSLKTPVAVYSQGEDRLMEVTVGYDYEGDAPEGTQVVNLAEEFAVCGVHLGAMDRIRESWQQLDKWALENGYQFAGPCRELYVRAESEDQQDWVTELQQPVSR